MSVTCLHEFNLVQNPGSRSDFHQNKSGSSSKARPAWQLLLLKETTLGLRDGEASELSTTGGPAPGLTIRSCLLDVARPRPWISSTQSPIRLPTVLRASPGPSYSVHPVQEPYFSHRCSSVEGGSPLPQGSQSSCARLWPCLTQSRVHFQILNQLTPECHSDRNEVVTLSFACSVIKYATRP